MPYSPVAYTYEADHHCPSCAEARFGRCHGDHLYQRGYKTSPGYWDTVAEAYRNRFIACTAEHHSGATAVDGEGNPPGAIAPWDEWHSGEGGCEVLTCGTCWNEIDRVHVDDCTCEEEGTG